VATAIPAFCLTCGLAFESSLIGFVEGASVERMTLIGNRETCPRCGAMAETLEGTFNVRDGVIEVLAASDLTRDRLARLGEVHRSVRSGAIGIEDAAQQIAEELPAIAPWFERLTPKLRKAAIWMLLTTVSILASQAVQEARDTSATPNDVRQAVEQALRGHDVWQHQPVPQQPQAATPRGGGQRVPRPTTIVNLAEEADGGGMIQHRKFVHALILGPAVIAPLNRVNFLTNEFQGDSDALFIELAEDRQVIGVIGLQDVTFEECRFEGVGIAGTPDTIAHFRREMFGR
jgi:hypothetical protein